MSSEFYLSFAVSGIPLTLKSEMQHKISHFSRLFSGLQSRKGVKLEAHGSHFLLQIRDFGESRKSVDWESLGRINATGVDPESYLQAGDVVFLAKGARNFAFAIPESIPSPLLAGSYFFVLRLKQEAFAPYVAWFLNQEPARRHFVRNATTGAHMPVVRREDMENLMVPLPPLETQHKIVEFAGLAEKQSTLLAELAEKKKALATAACLRAAGEFL